MNSLAELRLSFRWIELLTQAAVRSTFSMLLSHSKFAQLTNHEIRALTAQKVSEIVRLREPL